MLRSHVLKLVNGRKKNKPGGELCISASTPCAINDTISHVGLGLEKDYKTARIKVPEGAKEGDPINYVQLTKRGLLGGVEHKQIHVLKNHKPGDIIEVRYKPGS